MFSLFETPATIERLGDYVDDKSTLEPIAGEIFGAFRPIENDENIIGLHITGQAYRFDVDDEVDVRVNDRLTINDEVYTVRGVKKFNFKSMDVKACFLERPQKSP